LKIFNRIQFEQKDSKNRQGVLHLAGFFMPKKARSDSGDLHAEEQNHYGLKVEFSE